MAKAATMLPPHYGNHTVTASSNQSARQSASTGSTACHTTMHNAASSANNSQLDRASVDNVHDCICVFLYLFD